MTEASTVRGAHTAGALLRAAREERGLHIAALATSIKVSPQRLEALEADRYDQLLDPTFVRALAQTVCRALKIDAGPVLALLPHSVAAGDRLEHVSGGLRAPYRERVGGQETRERAWTQSPAFWATGLVLLAALAVYFVPSAWLHWPSRATDGAATESPAAEAGSAASGVPGDPPADAVPAPSAEVPPTPPATAPDATAATQGQAQAPSVAAETNTALAPATAAGPGAVAPAASAAAGGEIVLNARAQTWVEVRDGTGRVVVQRTMEPGESVSAGGTPPWRLKIGNATGTTLSFRGRAVSLEPSTRDNVARLELK